MFEANLLPEITRIKFPGSLRFFS